MSKSVLSQPKFKYLGFGIGGGVLVAIISLTALVGFKFTQYRAEGGSSPSFGNTQVILVEPYNGSEIPVGIPVSVESVAIGPKPFISIELWVNGQLSAAQSAPPGGKTPLYGFFTWVPEAPGAHTIVVRALLSEVKAVYSSSNVVVAVIDENAPHPAVDPDTGMFPVGAQPTDQAPGADTFVAGGGDYAPPQPPGPEDEVVPGRSWSGTPVEWVARVMSQIPPGAPELLAEAEACTAVLQIHNLSQNEEGFIIYRQVPGSPVWEKVTTLASSDHEWISFTDENVIGGRLYYVSAFNGKGESSSNLALVNVEAGECMGQIPTNSQITLVITNIIPTAGTSNNYCYRSFDGNGWGRWPQDGFLNSHNEPILLSDARTGEPLFDTLDLRLKCWGWAGGELVFLGQALLNNLDPRQPGSYQLDMHGLSLEVLLGDYGNFIGEPIAIPYGGGPAFNPALIFFDFATLPKINWDMPLAYPLITTSLDQCIYHAPEFNAKYCSPHLGFTAGPDGPNPQPYLIWDPTTGGTCGWSVHPNNSDGKLNSEQCKTFEEMQHIANSSYGYVGFEIVEHNSKEFKAYEVSQEGLRVLVIPPLVCEGKRTFKVRIIYREEGSNPVYQASPWSYPVSWPCSTTPTVTEELIHSGFTIDVPVENLGLPGINSWLTYDPAECYALSEADSPNCQVQDGYQLGPNGDNPQPYVVWEIAEELVCDEDGSCSSLDKWVQAFIPNQYGFELIEKSTAGFRMYSISGGMGFSPPPLTCNGDRNFQVRWFFKNEAGEYIVSLWNNEISVPCIEPQLVTPIDYVNINPSQYLAINMPMVEGEITYDPDECIAHLPPSLQNPQDSASYCGYYDAYYDSNSYQVSQPYLVWTILPWCPSNFGSGGTEPSNCISYDEWLEMDGTIGFSIYETNASNVALYNVTTPHVMTMIIPPYYCTGDRTFVMRIFYYTSDGNPPINIASQYSNPITVPCNK
jgi:hypothetical protein